MHIIFIILASKKENRRRFAEIRSLLRLFERTKSKFNYEILCAFFFLNDPIYYLSVLQISQNTLQGLHQICKLVQAGDYAGGLSVHTQLVSGPDFSQIASFMPGIKVLLQCALQLGVYIR
jgi:hypothetical protein